MDHKPGKTTKNPRDNANFWSKIGFWWLYPLLVKGCQRPLQVDDLTDPPAQTASLRLGDLVQGNWEKELKLSKLKGRKPLYLRALVRSFGISYLFYGIFAFFEECVFRILNPMILGRLVQYYNGDQRYTKEEGYMLSTGIVIVNVAILLLHHPFFYGTQLTGMKIRIGSCALIYRKALRLSPRALGKTTVGQMVNLLSNDVNRFDTSVVFVHYLWIAPLQTLISILVLWREIGPACLAGMAVVLLFIPVQSYMGKFFSKLRLATAIRTDERVRIMNEMVSAMRVIKMYAWEKPFEKIIELARKVEIDVIMKSNYFRATNLTLFFTSSKIVIFISLLVYVLSGEILTAEKVFVTTSMINSIRLTMTLFFPYGVSMGSETLISCKRIQTFLEMEEIEDDNQVVSSNLRPKQQDTGVRAEALYARWDPTSGEDTLKDVSFSVQAGETMAIIGSVGSGKSSLLHAILSELPIKEGSINVQGKISYASQEPWLFSGSVRDNILFGQSYDAKRYKEVIRVCALERDLELFPAGDRTPVGEKGVSLSGGQKARINLARAIYYDADIYLLDDPLSAVDSHVGKHLFEQCVSGFLRHKATLLATHQLQFIKTTSHVLVLKNGHVEGHGTYNQLKTRGLDFALIIEEGEEEQGGTVPPLPPPSEGPLLAPVSRITKFRRASQAWSMLHGEVGPVGDETFDNVSLFAPSGFDGSVLSLMEDDFEPDFKDDPTEQKERGAETKSTGTVNLKVYGRYFMLGGGLVMVSLFFLLNILAQMLYTGSDYWLSYWSNQEQLYGESTLELMGNDGNSTGAQVKFASEDRLRFVYIYAAITACLVVMAFTRSIVFFKICMTSSRNLHNRMFSAIIRVPMLFFETHPIGQILNRFTKDTGQVDDLLPQAMYDFLTIFFNFLGIVSVIMWLNIWLAVPTFVLGIFFFFVRWVYISSARDIKRLEGITRSPVFTHLSSTFEGLSTIRAFKAQHSCSSMFDAHQDFHSCSWFLFLCSSRLFGVYLDALSNVYIAIVTYSFMFQEGVLSGDVGLGISSAMVLSGMLQWGARQSAEVESFMTSVERILDYSKLTPEVTEAQKLVPKKSGWPTEGKLRFEDVFLRYNEDDPPVLKNLNFTIDSAHKIGIVGRTGAGKSSLLSCLFRLTPPEGKIIVDEVDTSTLLLEDLRRSLSIIPQDPTLFTGTVRYNLDPFTDYSDDQIWSALDEVQLKNSVGEMNGQLTAHITEGGRNLSVGQRQLMCLARAILKHNKILVMDEATANVDPQTDSWIQKTIRDKFTDCTVLTIAHRLHTVMDSDKVMVMDSGRLMEFDSPHELLKDDESIFFDLVKQTGTSTANQLKKMAQKAYYAKNKSSLLQENHVQCPVIANDLSDDVKHITKSPENCEEDGIVIKGCGQDVLETKKHEDSQEDGLEFTSRKRSSLLKEEEQSPEIFDTLPDVEFNTKSPEDSDDDWSENTRL